MLHLHVEWAELKAAHARNFPIYYIAFPKGTVPETFEYEVFGIEGDRFYTSRLSQTEDAEEFEEVYKDSTASVVSNKDAVIAMTAPAINSLGASLVEVTSKISQNASYTVVSHDFSEPTTWWQNSVQVQNEELEHEGSGVYISEHPLWINVEHPKVFADETLDVAAWAGAGFPGNLDPYYRSWWMPDSTIRFRNHYYPAVQIQPGGAGDWIIKAANDATYGHALDYNLGKIHFTNHAAWSDGTKVRATYFYTEETHDKALFEIGPPQGKIWHLIRTEVQLTVSASWQDTIRFYGKQGGIAGTRARYKTYGNMQSTATSAGSVILNGGIAESAQAWPASADNGWIYGGCAGLRNLTKAVEVDPWEYKKPFELTYGKTVGVSLAEGKKFLTADIANVTLYFDQYNE